MAVFPENSSDFPGSSHTEWFWIVSWMFPPAKETMAVWLCAFTWGAGSGRKKKNTKEGKKGMLSTASCSRRCLLLILWWNRGAFSWVSCCPHLYSSAFGAALDFDLETGMIAQGLTFPARLLWASQRLRALVASAEFPFIVIGKDVTLASGVPQADSVLVSYEMITNV